MSPAANDDGIDEDKDGPMDRLAKFFFAHPKSPITAYADEARIGRIHQCRELERILKACQSAQAGGDATETALPEAAASSRSRARISRFFKWDPEEPTAEAGEAHADGKSALSEAAATFYGNSGEGEARDKRIIQKAEASKSTPFSKSCAREAHELCKESCRKIQVRMSRCVNKHAAELAERVQAAKEAAKKQQQQ
ncbi:hypothetical protein ACHAWF_006728 [Thalassiosira exigua]